MKVKSPGLYLFCILCFLSLPVLAQIPTEPLSAKSPNVASLGLYGDIPVSNYTGIPNISIPLYTLTNKSISVPISLSYHSSGFRPDMHPGWVGQGWTLFAAGVISRTIRGGPDEYSNSNITNGTNNGVYFNTVNSYLNSTNWYQTSTMTSLDEGTGVNYDTEPDEFTFNFGNYSGSFYIDMSNPTTRTFRVKCDKPLKVTFNGAFLPIPNPMANSATIPTGNSKTFAGFTITTEDGTQYVFGATTDVDAIEYSAPFYFTSDPNYSDAEEWTASAWHLTKIIAVNGEDVDFKYARGYFVNQMYIAVNARPASQGVFHFTGGAFIFSQTLSCFVPNYVSGLPTYYSGKLVWPTYLKSIEGGNTLISFKNSNSVELRIDSTAVYNQTLFSGGNPGPGCTYACADNSVPYLGNNYRGYYTGHYTQLDYPTCLTNLQWRQLDTITVSQTSHNDTVVTPVKSFAFNYSRNTSVRLTLNSVTEIGADGITKKQPYQFAYYTPNPTTYPVPGYMANMTDHWGFYNNTIGDITNPTNYYNTRNPNSNINYVAMGVLNQITYPTGGVTKFGYELNDYSRQLNLDRTLGSQQANAVGGGLRIKEIKSYDPTNPTAAIDKKYYYGKGYANNADTTLMHSSGILGGQFLYYYTYNAQKFNAGTSGDYLSATYFTSFSALPGCENAQGSPIGYSEVTEKRNDGSYTRFLYSNFDTGSLDEAPMGIINPVQTPYSPFSSTDAERGNLLYQRVYNTSNQEVQSKSIQYTALNKTPSYVIAIKKTVYAVCPGTQDQADEGTAYKQYYYSYFPTTEIDTSFDISGNNAVATTKTYTYDANKLDSIVLMTDSKGEQLKTMYNHTSQMAATESPAGVYHHMLAANVLEPVIEQRRYNGTTQLDFVRNNYTEPYTGKFFTTSTEGSTLGNASEVRMQATYDDQGNIVTESKNGGPVTSYIWGYGGLYPVAKVENAAYSTVVSALGGSTAVTSFRNNIEPTPYTLTSFIAPLRKSNNISLRNTLVTSYYYTPLVGINTITDPKGENSYYEYDPLLRLMNIKDYRNNIVKSYCYNYAGQAAGGCYVNLKSYASQDLDSLFSRSCDTGYKSSNVPYDVPLGAYTSTLSQEDANNQARNDFLANGPRHADSLAVCLLKINFSANNHTTAAFISVTFYSSTYNLTQVFLNLQPSANNVLLVPTGTYSMTVVDQSFNPHTYTLGTRTPQFSPAYTFTSVNVTPGSSDLNLSIN